MNQINNSNQNNYPNNIFQLFQKSITDQISSGNGNSRLSEEQDTNQFLNNDILTLSPGLDASALKGTGPIAAVNGEGTSPVVDEGKTWDIEVNDRFRNFGHKEVDGELIDENGNWKDTGTAVSMDQLAAMSPEQKQAFCKKMGIDPASVEGKGNAANAVTTPPDNYQEILEGNGPVNISQNKSTGESIKGIDPLASDALRKAGFTEDDVVQGLGNASASAGTHKAEPGSEYTAAVDLSTAGKSDAEIRDMLERLRSQGFACWYRGGEKWESNEHIHAIYSGIPMKESLQNQVEAYVNGKDGLVGDNDETYAPPTDREKNIVSTLYASRYDRVSVA